MLIISTPLIVSLGRLCVGVPCGASSFNLANVECVAIGECSKNVYNHLVYCKIGNKRVHIALDSESTLLLTRAGRDFLLDIANPRERFGHLKKKTIIINQQFYRRHF